MTFWSREAGANGSLEGRNAETIADHRSGTLAQAPAPIRIGREPCQGRRRL